MHPIYKYLKRNSKVLYNYKAIIGETIKEDFSKFLVDKEGKVVKFYKKDEDFEIIRKDISSCISAK